MPKRVPCKLSDTIKCLQCGRVCLVKDLLSRDSIPFPRSDGLAGDWQPVSYYCPCDGAHPLVHDPGDGELIIIDMAQAKLVSNSS